MCQPVIILPKATIVILWLQSTKITLICACICGRYAVLFSYRLRSYHAYQWRKQVCLVVTRSRPRARTHTHTHSCAAVRPLSNTTYYTSGRSSFFGRDPVWHRYVVGEGTKCPQTRCCPQDFPIHTYTCYKLLPQPRCVGRSPHIIDASFRSVGTTGNILLAQNIPQFFSAAGAMLCTPLGKLTTLARPPSCRT